MEIVESGALTAVPPTHPTVCSLIQQIFTEPPLCAKPRDAHWEHSRACQHHPCLTFWSGGRASTQHSSGHRGDMATVRAAREIPADADGTRAGAGSGGKGRSGDVSGLRLLRSRCPRAEAGVRVIHEDMPRERGSEGSRAGQGWTQPRGAHGGGSGVWPAQG